MSDLLDKFKSKVPVIALVFYTYGYSYLSVFYGFFDISIEYYVDLTDILFKTINILIFLSVLFLVQEVILILWSTLILKVFFSRIFNRKIKNRDKNEKVYERYYTQVIEKSIDKHLESVSFLSFIIIGLALIFMTKEYLTVLTFFFPFFIVKLYKIIPKQDSEIKTRLFEFSSVALFLILLVCFILWGYNDASYIKESDVAHKIEFTSGNDTYKTGFDELNFIGETSSFVFIYDKKERKTLIFNKGSLIDYKVIDTSLTKQEEERLSQELIESLDALFNVKKPEKH